MDVQGLSFQPFVDFNHLIEVSGNIRYTLHSFSTPMPYISGRAHIVLYHSRACALPIPLPTPLRIRHMMHLQMKKTKKSRTFIVYPCVLLPYQITDVVQAVMDPSLVLPTLSVLQAKLHVKRFLGASVPQEIEVLTKKCYSMRMK